MKNKQITACNPNDHIITARTINILEKPTLTPYERINVNQIGPFTYLDIRKQNLYFYTMWIRPYQRKGMGLLEYQDMSSLRDVIHNEWSWVHLLYNSRWKFHKLSDGQLLSGQPVWYGKGRWYSPSIIYKITPASSQPGKPPCWAIPLAFGLIGSHSPADRMGPGLRAVTWKKFQLSHYNYLLIG